MKSGLPQEERDRILYGIFVEKVCNLCINEKQLINNKELTNDNLKSLIDFIKEKTNES